MSVGNENLLKMCISSISKSRNSEELDGEWLQEIILKIMVFVNYKRKSFYGQKAICLKKNCVQHNTRRDK